MSVDPISLILKTELQRRKSTNLSYSLRSFSRYLEISPATLSRLLNDKASLSVTSINKILQKLCLSEEDIKSIRRHYKENQKLARRSHFEMLDNLNFTKDIISILNDWRTYVILELLQQGPHDAESLSYHITTPLDETKELVNLLLNKEFIEISPEGKLKLKQDTVGLHGYKYTTNSMTDRHKQILALSAKTLDSMPSEKINYTSMTMSFDPRLIPQIRKRIEKFHALLKNFIVKHNKKNQVVYEMQISLFPLTPEQKKNP